MKVIYILSLGHSGSTLLDSALGRHKEIHSSGELKSFGWQLYKSRKEEETISNQNICSCGKPFRKCSFWPKVAKEIELDTDVNIFKNPRDFDMHYFNQFSYQNSGGFTLSFTDRIYAYFSRVWLEFGGGINFLIRLFPNLKNKMENNWMLYEKMSKISNSEVIVDSSKHILIALLLKSFKSESVSFVILHRDLYRLASSMKRRAEIKSKRFDIYDIIKKKKKFNSRVNRIKKNFGTKNIIELSYEDLVKHPLITVNKVFINQGFDILRKNKNDSGIWIYPNEQHLVAGNPMRYRGKQKILSDNRFKSNLTNEEISIMEKAILNNKFN